MFVLGEVNRGHTLKVAPRDTAGGNFNMASERLFRERKRLGDAWPPRRKEHGNACSDSDWSNAGSEYCQKTSLHGLKYVGDGELSLFERLFWLATFAMGVLAAAYFITILYNRWSQSPMIISLSSEATLLDTIPFPAVTICNMNDAKRSVAEFVARNRGNDSESVFERHMLQKMCGESVNVSRPAASVNASWSKIQNFMIKVSQPCHSMLVSCSWKSEAMHCGDMFNPELTDEGMCCSFNKVERGFMYRNPRQLQGLNYTFPYPGIDWTPEGGYPPGTPPNANPWRAIGAGKGLGLSVVLDAEVFDYYCSSTASVGFKVLLHNPVETPKISEFAYFIPTGEEIRVEITPRISTTTQSLVNIPEGKRRCVFGSERKLRFYRTYTQRNCELECQSNFTLARCKCVPFYLPKDGRTRVCGTADDDCVQIVKDVAEKRVPSNATFGSWNKGEEEEEEKEEEGTVNCSCLPSCVQIIYGRQMSTSKLDSVFKVDPNFLNGKDEAYYVKNMAVVHFFFVETSFMSFEKGEIFGFTDFLSNTGGLLGLFLGFSFMSAAEIAYFVTIKAFCARLRRSQRQQPQQQQRRGGGGGGFNGFPFAK